MIKKYDYNVFFGFAPFKIIFVLSFRGFDALFIVNIKTSISWKTYENNTK